MLITVNNRLILETEIVHDLSCHPVHIKKVKAVYSISREIHLGATGHHLPYGITQCYLGPDISEHTPS